MWIRACLAALVLAAISGRAGECVNCAMRIGSSVMAFERNYRILQQRRHLTAVDRLIVSLMLSSPEPRK